MKNIKVLFLGISLLIPIIVFSCQNECEQSLNEVPLMVKYIYKIHDDFIKRNDSLELDEIVKALLNKDLENLSLCSKNTKDEFQLFFSEWTVLLEIKGKSATYLNIDNAVTQFKKLYDYKYLHKRENLKDIIETTIPRKENWYVDQLILSKFSGSSVTIKEYEDFFFKNGNPSKTMKDLIIEFLATKK